MASDTLASQPYIDTNALAFALYYARELAEASDEKTRALAADKISRTFSDDQAGSILQFIDYACDSVLIKNAVAYQSFVDTVEKYRTGNLTMEETLVGLINACREAPRVARLLKAFLPPGWCIGLDSRGFGYVRTDEQRDFLLIGAFGGMIPPMTGSPPSYRL